MNGLLKNFPWRWVALGVLAYAIFLLATFPAARLVTRLQTYNIQLAGVSGSIWHGHAAAVQTRGLSLGPTEWRVSFLRFFLGKLSIEIHGKREDGAVDTVIEFGLGGKVALRALQANLPIAALSGMNFPGGWPNGWQGQLQLRFDRLQVVNRWPSEAQGQLSIVGLEREAPLPPQPLGDHHLIFTKGASNNLAGNNLAGNNLKANDLTGAISSSPEAPLDIAGTVQLTPNHTCLISVLIKLRPNASPALRQEFEHSILPKEQDGWRMQFEFAAASF